MSKVSNEEFQIRKEENKKQISNTILQVENLSAGYENEQVIKDISFTLSKGEIFCLAGESGSGKSTVLKALLSFYDIDVMDGDIRIFDTSVKDLAAKKRAAYCSEKMGVVFQNPGETFNPIRSYKKQFIETLKSHLRPVSIFLSLKPIQILDAPSSFRIYGNSNSIHAFRAFAV